MDSMGLADRRRELSVLLAKMRNQPSRDWSEIRDRVVVLARMIGAKVQAPLS